MYVAYFGILRSLFFRTSRIIVRVTLSDNIVIFIHSFIHSFIYSFIHSFIHSFIAGIYNYIAPLQGGTYVLRAYVLRAYVLRAFVEVGLIKIIARLHVHVHVCQGAFVGTLLLRRHLVYDFSYLRDTLNSSRPYFDIM